MTTLTKLKIWDGADYVDADTLCIRNGLIDAIGDNGIARAGDSIDCAGCTAIPGLIDAHVHLELNPDDQRAPEKTLPSVVPLMRARAEQMLQVGITTVRDLGGGAWHELALRDAIQAGAILGPRLLCSGQPITSPRGHCHFWGGEAHDEAEACAVLERQVAHKVDLIKVMATGGRLTAGSEPTDTQFPQETLNRIVGLAKRYGLPVAAHCHGTEGILRAARAGVSTIEHCSWVGKEGWASDYEADVAQIIVDHGVWVSPTVNKGWQRMLDSKTGNVLKRVRHAYQDMLALGIPMVASTDAGIPGVYHQDLPHALIVFGKIVQLTHSQTLQSATSAAARALGIAHITGSLQPGLAADILIVDGDPIEDLSAITRPVSVFSRGRVARAA